MDELSDIQLADLLGGDEQDAQSRAKALAAALRQQQAGAQDQQAMAGLSGFFNAPAATTMGKAYGDLGAQNYAQAGEQLQKLGDVPQQRLKMALERQQVAKGQRENDVASARAGALADPGSVTSRVRTGLAGKLGLDLPGGTAGSAIDDKELELAQKQQASAAMAAAARQRVAAASSAAGVQLDPGALDQAANLFLTTGVLPSFGTGKTGGALKAAVANRAAQLRPGSDIAGNKAEYHAGTASLSKQQTQADLMQAAEETALSNLSTFEETAKKVKDTGSPLFNMGGREFSRRVMGDPSMAAFAAARQTAVSEIGKVLAGSLGGGGLSDSQRHEVENLIGPDATLAQISAAATVLRRDMANRKKAVQGQIDTTRARMTGGNPPATEPAVGAPVQMKFPDGSVHPVTPDKIEKARLKGAVPVSA